MTKSTGHNGLILVALPPNLTIASLKAAKSTQTGTPVKSYKMTRAGLNGISIYFGAFFYQSKMLLTSFLRTLNSSQFLTAFSNKIRMLKGSYSLILLFLFIK